MASIRGLTARIKPAGAILAIYLFIYACLGINTELHYIEKHPMPTSLMADYKVYKKSVKAAIRGENPYAFEFRYPPPALLIIEFFYHIPNPNEFLQDSIYLTTNISLLILMIYGLARHYGYRLVQVWYWFPLVFFFGPVLEGLHVGQINFITEFGILLVLVANSTFAGLAGMGLSLAITTKLTPAAFLLYFFSVRNTRAILAAILGVLVLGLLTGLRYSFDLYPMFTATFGNMLQNFHTSLNSQSLFSKLVTNRLLPEAVATNPTAFQNGLTAYMFTLFMISTILAYINRQSEPQFIILGLGSFLVSNWMWYHHYIFFIVPILTWAAWSRQNVRVLSWCLLGFLIIQIDRWYLTTGLLIHIFGHISMLALLIGQIRMAVQPRSMLPQVQSGPPPAGNSPAWMEME